MPMNNHLYTPVYPKPKICEWNTGLYHFGKSVVLSSNVPLTEIVQNRIILLWKQFTYQQGQLVLREIPFGSDAPENEKGPYHAVLYDSAQRKDNQAEFPECPTGSVYQIMIDEKGVRIAAKTEKAFLYAIYTLVQMITPVEINSEKASFSFPCGKISDQTRISVRMLHICIFPETSVTSVQKLIRLAGLLKFTHIIIEFWGTYSYSALPEMGWKGYTVSSQQVRELVEEIRSFGMEPVPMINHLGHASQNRYMNGKHAVLDQAPWHQLLFEPDGWTWCISNPDTIKVLKDMRLELEELFGKGGYFHLGCDEAESFASCPKCRRPKEEEAAFLADYLNLTAAEVRKEGRRPIIWHDELLSSKGWQEGTIANGDRGHITYPALDKIDRNIVIADWQYNLREGGSPTSAYFMSKGFDVLLCPWIQKENVSNLSNACRSLGAMGMICTIWHMPEKFLPRMPDFSDLLWGYAEDHSPASASVTASLLRKVMYEGSSVNYLQAGWGPHDYNFHE